MTTAPANAATSPPRAARVWRFVRGSILAVAALVSIAACVGIIWLQRHEGRFEREEVQLASVYVPTRHARYALRAGADGVSLYAPPPCATTSRQAADLVAELRNSQIEWGFWWNPYDEKDGKPQRLYLQYDARSDWAWTHSDVFNANRADVTHHLLDALEDPERIVAAHQMLHRFNLRPTGAPPYRPPPSLLNPPTGPVTIVFKGLVVVLSDHEHVNTPVTAGGPVNAYVSRATIDRAQFPALRAAWHRRLDVPVRTASYRLLIPLTATPAILIVGLTIRARVRRRRRIRNGMCAHCGYDKRANPTGPCSECGR